jgi:sigma-B regulation protein RsbU (phosphoserine phosphatase)
MQPADIRQRFEEFAARLQDGKKRTLRQGSPALREDYWGALQDLFTRGVTAQDLWAIVAQEPRDTVRYFTRELDFSAFQAAPWHVRYPRTAFAVFLAVAHRLSPARRVLFAVAVPLLVVSLAAFVARHLTQSAVSLSTILLEPAFPALLLFFLLVLELRDKLVLKGDLEVARQIQFGLLPFEPVDGDGYRIRTAMRPANTVGGDYFDIIPLGDDRFAVAIGDVAGKGMPAALLMALLQGSLRTLISAGFRGCDLMTKLNAHLFASIPPNRLVTLFYAEVDRASGHLACVNAGHNPPFLFDAQGSFGRIQPTGVALGILEETRYETVSVDLVPGGRLFLFTDGVTEAENSADVQYDDPRLEAFLVSHRALEPRALIDQLVENVLAFCGTAPPRDDMTLLCLERTR